MKKYAVVRVSGKQYKVSEGEEFLVDKLDLSKNREEAKAKKSKIEPDKALKDKVEVLLFVDDKNVKVGKPDLSLKELKLKVVTDEEKGKKLSILKFKAKSRYRKKIGFRSKYTRLLLEKIS